MQIMGVAVDIINYKIFNGHPNYIGTFHILHIKPSNLLRSPHLRLVFGNQNRNECACNTINGVIYVSQIRGRGPSKNTGQSGELTNK